MNSIINNEMINTLYIGVSSVLIVCIGIIAIWGTIKMLKETNRIKDTE